MNALNVIGVASNLSFFVIVIAGILATLEDTKIKNMFSPNTFSTYC